MGVKIISTDNENSINTDVRNIEVNGFHVKALFDTGASANFIGKDLLGELGIKSIKRLDEKMVFLLADGKKCEVVEKTDFTWKNENKYVESEFFLLEGAKRAMIIGFPTIKGLQNASRLQNKSACNIKEFPITCTIPTDEKKIVSWNRPVKSYFLSLEFERKIAELEKMKIVESSQSKWCHPVVLLKKKNDDLRFCVDFRRLNEITRSEEFLISRISEMISTLYNKEIFSKIDSKDGFFYVKMMRWIGKKLLVWSAID